MSRQQVRNDNKSRRRAPLMLAVAAGLAGGLLVALPAQAARPLSTGVASVNDPGECEQGIGRQSLRSGGERGWLFGGELNAAPGKTGS